jgi:hypothetical protein
MGLDCESGRYNRWIITQEGHPLIEVLLYLFNKREIHATLNVVEKCVMYFSVMY